MMINRNGGNSYEKSDTNNDDNVIIICVIILLMTTTMIRIGSRSGENFNYQIINSCVAKNINNEL